MDDLLLQQEQEQQQQEQEQEQEQQKNKSVKLLDLSKQKPKIYSYQQPKEHRYIQFVNITNTKYEVIKEPYQEIGYSKTYKDFLQEGLNPVVNSNTDVYGSAKVLKPKTQVLNEMKLAIDNATNQLYNLQQQYNQQVQNIDDNISTTTTTTTMEVNNND